MVLPLSRLHHVRAERKALMAARPFVPERRNGNDSTAFSETRVQQKR